MSAFKSYSRGAPRVPSETCPLIDGVLNRIGEAESILAELSGRRSDLEDIRKANGDLRELSLYWRNAAEELAARVDELESEVEDLADRLNSQSKAA